MDLRDQVAALTPEQAESCLKGVLKGLVETDERHRDLAAVAPASLAEAVQEAAADVGAPLSAVAEPPPEERGRASRLVLQELAVDSRYAPRVEAWLRSNRPTLLDPVTAALVLAGIVMALSVEFKVVHENKGGKKTTRVEVTKKATAPEILKMFFHLF